LRCGKESRAIERLADLTESLREAKSFESISV
jgi:hypothetical protein